MDNMSRLVAWSARREDPSRGQGWAGLLSLHSDPAEKGWSLWSPRPAAALRALGSGLASAPALPTPPVAFVPALAQQVQRPRPSEAQR